MFLCHLGPGTQVRSSLGPLCCLSLPLGASLFTCFSSAVQHCHGSPGVCPCPAVGPVFLPSWAQELFVLVPNGEQVPKRREQQS